MIDLREIKKDPEQYKKRLRYRGIDPDEIDRLIEVYNQRNRVIREVEDLRHRQKEDSNTLKDVAKEGKKEKIESMRQKLKNLSEEIKKLDEKRKELDNEFKRLVLNIPNIPAVDVPEGEDEASNVEIRRWGERDYEKIESHWDTGERLDIFDFKSASTMSGSRFVVLKRYGARLERALINFMLDVHTKENGYTEFMTPHMVRSDALTNTGQFPKFKEDVFAIEDRDLFLIPTAEVTLVNLFANSILKEEDLPIRVCAYTPCYRKEAGSYGEDVRGIIRQHQFDKVELVTISRKEESFDILEQMVTHAEKILQYLELQYRVVLLSQGDMGFSAAKTYDLEVYLPSQRRYREISSVSNCTDFQARRAKIRYRSQHGITFAHTLNGSGLAVGRTMVAILEQHLQKDGTVRIPERLIPYMGGVDRLE